MKKKEQVISLVSVVVLALVLPGFLRLANNAVRSIAGAEGRLAAITVETDRIVGPIPRVWAALAQGGEDLKTFLDKDQDKIARFRPEYIRIDHIYDQFGVVKRDGSGKLTYDWSELDGLVDKMASVGAKPFFSLSYMPEVMASGDMVSTPKNWAEWSELVKATVEHYSGEKGIENVYYEVWNEPDLFGKWKMGGSRDYKDLYMYAARGAAAARGVTAFKIGGPATTGLYRAWVDKFFPFILENKLRLDFVSWHRYDLDINKYISDADSADKWLDSHPYFSQVEKIVSEMGPNSSAGGENDTAAGAAHLVASARELMFKIRYGFNFAVTGSWGVVNKPRGQALAMLAGLGSQRLSLSGEGSWVRAIGAMKNNAYQVLLANFDPKGTHSEIVPVSFIRLSGNNWQLKKTLLGGQTTVTEIATTSAMIQREIPMQPNTVVLLELAPVSQ